MILRNEIYTVNFFREWLLIWNSCILLKDRKEWQSILSWMRVPYIMNHYFTYLEFQKCINKCHAFDKESEKECEIGCNKVYDEYANTLYDKYKDNKEKLD